MHIANDSVAHLYLCTHWHPSSVEVLQQWKGYLYGMQFASNAQTDHCQVLSCSERKETWVMIICQCSPVYAKTAGDLSVQPASWHTAQQGDISENPIVRCVIFADIIFRVSYEGDWIIVGPVAASFTTALHHAPHSQRSLGHKVSSSPTESLTSNSILWTPAMNFSRASPQTTVSRDKIPFLDYAKL